MKAGKIIILLITLLVSLQSADAQTRRFYKLIMRNTGTDTMYDGKTVRVFGFTQKLTENPLIPSATLYANEGDTLVIEVRNISQGDPHTVHLHGLDVDQANDGTPMTSFTIKHMETGTYKAVCKDAGTYIYHCHMADVVHVQMGMYGLLVVRPKDGGKTAWTGGPAYDKEYSWLTSEVDKSWHDSIPGNPNHQDTSAHEDFHIPPYNPQYFLVNGKAKHELKDSAIAINAKANERVYLRLSNIGFYMNEVVFPAALDATWIDSDGRPLPKEIKNNTIRLAPGERFGIMLKSSAEFIDSIAVKYINMNTHEAEDTEYVPLKIQGISGMEEVKEKAFNVNIFPNPATSSLNVVFKKPLNDVVQLSVSNTIGQQVKQENFSNTGEQLSLNIEGLPSGIYFLNIKTKEGIITRKFIINNNK